MPVKFQNSIGPAFLATYLVNNDVTGITQYEKDAADTFLKDAKIVNVVGAKALGYGNVSRYGMFGKVYGGFIGDLAEYTIEIAPCETETP